MSQAHWDSVYAANSLQELGWYEPVPSTLGLVTEYSTPADAVIDVGGGTSPLTMELARLGYRDLTVLDISERALGAARAALREHLKVVSWIHADVMRYRRDPDRRDVRPRGARQVRRARGAPLRRRRARRRVRASLRSRRRSQAHSDRSGR
jgi:2-polyprenyl-3-methyl-5-hydroxy-6-metoxy-1,4-benzoquinol methylase